MGTLARALVQFTPFVRLYAISAPIVDELDGFRLEKGNQGIPDGVPHRR